MAEVYLELMGGRQQGLVLDAAPSVAQKASPAGGQSIAPDSEAAAGIGYRAPPRPHPLPSRITQAEQAAHDAFIAEMGDHAISIDPSDASRPAIEDES